MADFNHECPACSVGDLYVVAGEFETHIPVGPDGFAFADAKFVNTSEERVECGNCKRRIPMAYVTGDMSREDCAALLINLPNPPIT